MSVGCGQTGHRVAGQGVTGDCKAVAFVEHKVFGSLTLWLVSSQLDQRLGHLLCWAAEVTQGIITASTLATAVNSMNTERCVLCGMGSFSGKIVLPRDSVSVARTLSGQC